MGVSVISEPSKTETGTILGLVAGEGKLPSILAQSAKAQGYSVVALALSKDARTRVAPHADVHYEIAPGQLKRNLGLLKQHGCHDIVLIGKVPKIALLRNAYKLDWMAIKEISMLPNFNDDTIQQRCGDFMDEHGLRVLTQSQFLRHLFPDVGVITKRQPTVDEYADIQHGLRIAREISLLDIGQTVAVKDRMILAIEALEGTDEAIKRAVQLANGPVVVVKVAKKGHDQRFDIPTVGIRTLDAMRANKPGGCLAVAAGDTMIVDREETAAYADKLGISMVAV